MAPLKRFSDIINELSMKSDKKLPNLKTPVKGKKGTSKFMRMKIHNAPYTSDYKKAMNASVQSADRKPEKYIKPDGKVGIRMVKTDKEVIKKESIDNHPKVKAARKAHAAGTWDGNVNKEGEAVVHINGKPHVVTNKSKTKNLRKETIDHDRMRFQAAASQKKNQKKTDDKEKKSMAAKADMDMRARKEDVTHMTIHNGADGFNSAKKASHKKDYETKHGVKVSFSGNGVTYSGKKANVTKAARGHFPDHKEDGMPSDIHKWHDGKDISVKKEEVQVDEAVKNLSGADQVKAALKIIRDKRFNMKSQIDKKTAIQKISKDLLKDPKVKKEMDKIYEENIDEALNLAQRMKRSRLMKRMKSRIKIGRQRAMKKMANKKTIEKRAMRQARNQLAKKLTRGIPKKELTFARKQEIEKRLAKPALQQRIKRIAKRIFKDVRKKEVERKKG